MKHKPVCTGREADSAGLCRIISGRVNTHHNLCPQNHADGNWLFRKAGLALSAWNTNAYSKQKGP